MSCPRCVWPKQTKVREQKAGQQNGDTLQPLSAPGLTSDVHVKAVDSLASSVEKSEVIPHAGDTKSLAPSSTTWEGLQVGFASGDDRSFHGHGLPCGQEFRCNGKWPLSGVWRSPGYTHKL